MSEKFHSKHLRPESDSDYSEHHEQNHEQRNRELGEAARLATPGEQNDPEQEFIKLDPGQSYEIPTNSRVSGGMALLSLRRNHLRNITRPARATLEKNNIIAIICTPDQHFWLLDVQDDKRFMGARIDAKVPYLLIEANSSQDTKNNDPHAYFKGIRPGKTLKFGRSHDYNGRFDYPLSASRDHFEVSCNDEGQVSIKDLNSLNGTSIIITHELDTSSHEPTGDTGGKNLWTVTPVIESLRNVNRHGNRLFITLDGQEYPCLDRDATVFNGSIDALDHASDRSSDILIDSDSPEIQEAYDELKRQCDSYLSTIDRLKLVERVVRRYMSYNSDRMAAISKQNSRVLSDGSKLTRLSDYVRGGYGECRQQALFSACLLEKMEQDGLISGTIHVERNREPRGGHEWATFQEDSDNSVYVIDAAMKYVGKKEEAPEWDYRRP